MVVVNMTSMEQGKQLIIKELTALSMIKGYILIDDVLKSIDDVDFPIDEIDRFCEILTSRGIIIRDGEEDYQFQDDEFEEYSYDRSKLDYNAIFNKVISLDPSLTNYIDEVKVLPPPRRKEEATLIYHAKDNNAYAKERIITMYLKVALRIALWYFEKYSLPLDETIQDANTGLVIALEKIPQEIKFSTYAPWWIRQNIDRSTQGISNKYYLPAHIKNKMYEVIDLKNQHSCEECYRIRFCPLLINDICQQFCVGEDTAEKYLDILEEPLSIEEILDNELDSFVFSDNGELMDMLVGEEKRRNLKQNIETVLATLTDRECEVVKWRYGLMEDGKFRTLGEVGQIFNLTRERIRQIEARVFRKLRHPSRARILKLDY